MSSLNKYKVKPDQLKGQNNLTCLKLKSTEKIKPLEGIVGQERAVTAIKFGLSMDRRGYNIYVSGGWGSGRNSCVRDLTKEKAKLGNPPLDYIYVNNFKVTRAPISLGMEAGKGKEFIKDMEFIIDFMKKEVSNVFSSKDYENSRSIIIQEYHDSLEKIILELNKIGEQFGFKFGQNDKGLISIPLKNGEPMSEEDYRSLSQDEYEKLMTSSNKLSIETVEFFNVLRKSEEDFRGKLKSLDQQMCRRVVDIHLSSLRKKYAEHEKIIDYFNMLTDDIVDHLDKFKGDKEAEVQSPISIFGAKSKESFFDRYKVNLFIDNSEAKHAPVVFASNPTYSNLCGTIEYRNEMGILKTDFTQIKPGAIHEANGGYLIILMKDIIGFPYAWRGLKRAMLENKISIEPTGLYSGAIISSTLKPQAVPLDVKVVLIGDSYTYQLLYYYDEEFRKLFKVMADFDNEMDMNDDNTDKLIRFISKHVRDDKLRHFKGDAIRRVIEFSSRSVDDNRKLSTHLTNLIDLIHESDKYAEVAESRFVETSHVQQAIDGIKSRNSKYEEGIMEMFKDGDYLIDVEGSKVGEINGLAVIGTGQYSFGKPSKITVSTYQGRSGIINIEREARTSGSIHDKGVMILTGYLGFKYAQDKPLALSASIVFEQLYSGVEGDSASSTELYAILSSLSDVPIRQNIAVTGSVNQRGQIQPIGGVNEKIEGFFNVCKMKGLNGEQGVLIPRQNIKNLILSAEVIDAVKNNQFHIYSADTVDEGMEILTGVKAGIIGKNGNYPKNTIHYLVNKKLHELAIGIEKVKKEARASQKQPGVARAPRSPRVVK